VPDTMDGRLYASTNVEAGSRREGAEGGGIALVICGETRDRRQGSMPREWQIDASGFHIDVHTFSSKRNHSKAILVKQYYSVSNSQSCSNSLAYRHLT